ncbi:hypothetical protein [Streptomyces sp. NPDC003032]
MGKHQDTKGPGVPEPPQQALARQGSIAALGGVKGSVAMNIENATVMPSEAYQPIPDDAVQGEVSNIPRRSLFVGRTRELEELDAAFASPGGVVLRVVSGLGGVGKSALAAWWAVERAGVRVRWWMAADTEAAVTAGLADLARALQPGLAAVPAEVQVERALAWLARRDDWLVVLDNVNESDHISKLLDRAATGGGRVLITTRRATNWYQFTATIHLDVLFPTGASCSPASLAATHTKATAPWRYVPTNSGRSVTES